MAREPRNVAVSVRARLQNLAREQQANFQRVLTRYALERFLFRLSVSPHKELFVLKGAMLYAAWLTDPFRTTRDLDLLSLADRETAPLLETIRDVCAQPVADDGLRFDTENILADQFGEDRTHGAFRVRTSAQLGAAIIPVQVDVGFGQKLEYPRDGLYLYGPPSSEAPVSEIRYGVIGTAQGVQRFQAWSRMVSGFIDIPEPSARSREIEPQHVPFPGFEQAFGARWSVNPAQTISDIDSTGLRDALNIGNRHEAIMSAVGMYVDRLIAAQNRLENPPTFWFVVIPEEVYELGRPQSRVARADRTQGRVTVSAARARYLEVQPTLFGDEEKEAEVYRYATHFRRQLKARLLQDHIVTQIVRETTLAPRTSSTSPVGP